MNTSFHNKLLCKCAMLVLAIGIIFLVYYVSSSSRRKDAGKSSTSEPHPCVFRHIPSKITPVTEPCFEKTSVEAMAVARFRALRMTDNLTLPYCCHLLRMEGSHELIPTSDNIIHAMTDEERARRLFGRKVLLSSRVGLRFTSDTGNPLGENGESHRNLCLATFAEYGVPLDRDVRVGGRRYAVKDILRDSINEFILSQRELEWTAIAYTLYLDKGSWTNKENDRFTHDDIAQELLKRDRKGTSCGGLHILYAMTLMLRAGCLSNETHDRVIDAMRAAVAEVVAAQEPSGCWGNLLQGKAGIGNRLNTREKLLLTGHTLEWLERLPVELQPRRHVYASAGAWLGEELLRILNGADATRPGPEICPRAHAVCAVRALVKP